MRKLLYILVGIALSIGAQAQKVQAPWINATQGFQINGSKGSSGQCVQSTGSGSQWASCGGSSANGIVYLPAAGVQGTTAQSAWDFGIASQCTSPTAVALTGTYLNIGALQFAGGTPCAYYTYLLPSSLVGTTLPQLRFQWTSTSASTTAIWSLTGYCSKVDGTGPLDGTFNSFWAIGAQTSASTANYATTVTATSVSLPTGCAAGMLLHMRLQRTDSSSGTGLAATSPAFSFGMHALHYTDGFWTSPNPPWPSDSNSANSNTPISFDIARTHNNTSCHWVTLEPSRGSYNWTNCDAYINKAIASGQQVMWTLAYFPVWVQSTGCANAYPSGGSPQNCPIAVEQDFKDFITALVTRYYGKIKIYEGLNEPNEQNYWYNPTDWTHLNQMQSDMYNIVHANDSNASVLCPASSWSSFGGSWSPSSYVQAEITNGMGAYCDGFAFHSETNANPESSLATNVAVLSTVAGSAYPTKPVWDTEANWNGTATTLPATGDSRAQFVARYLLLSWAEGVRGVLWYAYEGDTESGTAGWGPLWNSSGVLGSGLAYEQMYKWVSGATISSALSTTPSLITSQWGNTAALWCFAVTRPGSYSATICWYDGGTGNNLGSGVTTAYTPPGGTVQYRNMYGTITPYTSGTIAVGNTPLIFENKTSYPITSATNADFLALELTLSHN